MDQDTSELLLTIIRASPGATRQQILKKTGPDVSDRSFTRYIGELLKARQVRSQRDGREVRFYISDGTVPVTGTSPSNAVPPTSRDTANGTSAATNSSAPKAPANDTVGAPPTASTKDVPTAPPEGPDTAPATTTLNSGASAPGRPRRRTVARDEADLPLPRSASPTAIANLAAKGLTKWLDQVAPGLPPELRQLIFWAVVVLVTVLGGAAARYQWFPVLIAIGAIALIVAVVIVARTRGNGMVNRPLGAQPPSAAPRAGSAVAAVADRGESDVGSAGGPQPTPAPDRGDPSRRRWRGLTAAIVALVLMACAAAAIWYWRTPSRPSDAAIANSLTRSAAPLPVRVVSLTPNYTSVGTTSCTFTYQAVLETTAPLYRRLDTAEYLRGRLPPPISELKFQISDVGPAPTPALKDIVLVTTSTAPGTTAMATGMIVAWRRDGAWTFTPQQGGFDRSRLAGEPKPDGAFAVDDPADLARLNAWLADQVAYAARVQTAAAAAAAERERARQQQSAAFAQLLRAGTLFIGTLTDPIRGTPQPVILEITASSAATQQLSIALRNDGGWTDARPFTGTWTLNTTADAAVVTLKSTTRDYIDSAGPLLQDRIDLSFAFELHADGTAGAPSGDLKSQISNFKSSAVTLRRVDPGDADALKADVLRPLTPALAATAAGLVYRGTATSRTTGTTEPLRLRFDVGRDLSLDRLGTLSLPNAPIPPNSGSQTRRDQEIPPYTDPAKPLVVNATLESTTIAGAVRPLRGTIVSNTYRVGHSPIQLLTTDSDAVARAGAKSVLALRTGTAIKVALRVEAGRIVGEDKWYTYAFAPEGNAEDRESGNVGNAPQPPAPIENRDSKIENSLPPFPAAIGAYVLVDNTWIALPNNQGKAYQTIAQKGITKLLELHFIEDAAAGQVNPPPTEVVGAIAFDGKERVPVVSGSAVVVVYVGPLAPPKPESVQRYSPLKDYPLLELVRLQLGDGMRTAPLFLVGPGSLGFGADRVEAIVEQPRPNVTVLRCQRPLGAGRYALSGPSKPYELETK